MAKYEHLDFDDYEHIVWGSLANETDQFFKGIYNACEYIFDFGDKAIQVIDDYEKEYLEGDIRTIKLAENFYKTSQIAKIDIREEKRLTLVIEDYGLSMADWLKRKASEDRDTFVLMELIIFAGRALQLKNVIYWYFLFSFQMKFITLTEYKKYRCAVEKNLLYLEQQTDALGDQFSTGHDKTIH